jgi:PAS domain S-box-containing protein
MAGDVRVTDEDGSSTKPLWLEAVEPLWNDGEYVLYRAAPEGGHPTLLVMSPAVAESRPGPLKRLEHAYALRDDLDPAWSARPLTLTSDQGRPLLLLEDPGGEPLARLLGRPMEIAPFLRTAIGLVNALGRLHERGLVHKDVKPSNILVDAASGHVALTGFGIASRLPRERQAPERPEVIAGTLAYMAPEQTGRMNRSVDSRSDLYAVGVTLYEMLTGALPFTAADPIEWVHCHVARQPTPPSECAPGLPPPVSAIVMKLLAKTPEDRYQTAAGVEADLRRCLTERERFGRSEPFPLGTHDVPDRLLVPEKLYGREAEVRALLEAFEQVVSDGSTRLVLVSGYSGIGKSSVVNELHKALLPPRGLFASGKFDQYKRDIPYATLAQAFQGIVRQILSQPEDEVARWRAAIEEVLGSNGQLLTNLIPELELVIGVQPAAPEVSPQDAQRRFQSVLRRFLGVFARAEHPLVLFLDDLQWLDAATLDFLDQIVTEPDVRYLLLVGAYRDNEVGPTHPLSRTLEAIRQTDARVSEIVLAPLGPDDVNRLVADALHCGTERARPLGDLVYEKTAGNPLFAFQFLTALADEGLLAFEPSTASWTCDLARVQRKGFAENVADLMIAKLNRLSPATLEPLKQLACLGSSVAVATLTIALGLSADDVHAALWEALRAGLVFRHAGTYSFLHDRVREATYGLIPEGERAALHLALGRRLEANVPSDKIEEMIFEIVGQLTRGAALITALEERERLAELNLVAGKRAQAATAYVAALTYLSAGVELLGEGAWERSYPLMFALQLNRAECEFLTGDMVAAEERLSLASVRAATVTDKAAVTCLRVVLYLALDQGDRAIRSVIEYLGKVGIEWSPHPSDDELKAEYERIQRRLAGHTIEALVDAPPMTDPDLRATMDVLETFLGVAMFTDRSLHDLAVMRMVNLSLEHGNCEASTVAYASVSTVLGTWFGAQTSLRYGQLALDLVDHRQLARFRAHVYMVFGQQMIPWARHLPSGCTFARRSLEAAQESGDFSYVVYSFQVLITLLLGCGASLDDVQLECESGLRFARQARFGFLFADNMRLQLYLIRSLRGLTPALDGLDGEACDQPGFEQRLEQDPRLAIAACFYWIRKLQASFFAGDYASAIDAAEKARPYPWATSSSFFECAEYHFYGALARAAFHDLAPSAERPHHLDALGMHHQQIAAWARTCPENFADRAALTAAEIARVEGRLLDAERLYEEAIRLAREQGFVHNEGLANERAARFYVARDLHTVADAHVRNARQCYRRWGAEGKVRQLDRSHPHLEAAPGSPSLTSTIDAAASDLDLGTWVKTSEALSGEIVLDRLIHTLMSIAVQHAGASRGLLLLPRDGELRVEAEATTDADTVTVRVRSAPATSAVLPESILRYVVRTHESVILGDASTDYQFATDPYVQRQNPRSILCLPLVKQTKQIGVLYLENNLAPHVFTAARIALLKLLASQAAISLENARLYTDLQRSEAYLAQGQELTRTGTWAHDLSTDELEWSEQIFRIFGRDPGDRRVTVSDFLAYVHPDDREEVERLFGRTRAEGGNVDHTFRIVRDDGQMLFLRSVGTPVYEDGVVNRYFATIMDVTEHECMTREIRGREAELRELVDLSPQALNVLSPDGMRCLYANQRACDQTGYTLEEILAPGWNMRVTHPDDWERLAGEFLEVIRGERSEMEGRILCTGRGYRWFLTRYNALRDEQGQIIRWYVTSTDIEDRKRAEESVKRENLALREEIDKTSMFEEIVGHSPAIRAVLERVAKVAPTESTVLITGETGTGKELVARAIHRRSHRSERPFVSVNCAAIPQALISSELFGHEKGAFTGALQRRLGRFELAEGGTLFLDEVGELPPETQIALLRVLQEREFERVGGTKPIRADVRVVAATNRDLKAAIDVGTFRSDLFYRLNVFPINIPPLRERREDIPGLVGYLVDRYASKAGKKLSTTNKNTMDLLQSYPWPGNIRELQNVIERSIIVCDTDTFSVDESWLAQQTPSGRPPDANKVVAQAEERATIEAALAETRGRVSGPRGAAAKLRMPASTLEAKIRSLGINKHRFKTI